MFTLISITADDKEYTFVKEELKPSEVDSLYKVLHGFCDVTDIAIIENLINQKSGYKLTATEFMDMWRTSQ